MSSDTNNLNNTDKKIICAFNLDDTIIFDKSYVDGKNWLTKCSVAETLDNEDVSFISDEVKVRLIMLSLNKNVVLVPVTSRNADEFRNLDLGVEFEYAITDCGAAILHNNKELEHWDSFICKGINRMTLLNANVDMAEYFDNARFMRVEDLAKEKFTDAKYIKARFGSVGEDGKEQTAVEVNVYLDILQLRYNDFTFMSHNKDIFALPNSFNKGVALRYLQHFLNSDTVVTTCCSMLDLCMTPIGNYVVIPEHSELIKNNYVNGGRIANAGINCMLYTFDIVDELVSKI